MWVFSSIAISLGLLSSLHCIGMCGPLALAVPVHQNNPFQKTIGALLYHGGRSSSYALLGLLLGLLGGAFASVFSNAQQYMSLGLGAAMLFYAIVPRVKSGNNIFSKATESAFNFLRAQMGKYFFRKGSGSLYFMGVLNGLLPCGMVYLALASSLATANMWKGMTFMLLFGIGTMPAMLTISLFGSLYPARWRKHLRLAAPYMFGLIGILLVLRGLQLGIPFISPETAGLGQPVNCHK